MVHLEHTVHASTKRSAASIVAEQLRHNGVLAFFRHPIALHPEGELPASGWLRKSSYNTIRALARVGPWGVGFLVWEAYGPGLG